MDINRFRTKTIYSVIPMANELPLKYPEKSTSKENGDYPGTLRFTPVNQEGNPVDGGKVIELYLPMSIQIGDKVELENHSMNALMGGLADQITGSGNTTAALTDQSSSGTFGDYLKAVAAGLAAKTGVTSITGVIQETTKTAPNPNTRAFFKQVGLRSFQFMFKMIPTSEREARIIRGIIKSFRTEMYPDSIYRGQFAVGYKIPNKYKIEAFYDDQELGIKIQPSFLESIMTNYNSSGMAFLKDPKGGDAHFSEIDLSLNFTEGRALNKKMVDEGGF